MSTFGKQKIKPKENQQTLYSVSIHNSNNERCKCIATREEEGKETYISWNPPVCWVYLIVLVCSGGYNRNNTNWVVYKQQTFISHSSGGGHWRSWQQQIQRLVRAFFLLHSLLTVRSQGRRAKGSFWSLFYEGSHPIHEGFTLMT